MLQQAYISGFERKPFTLFGFSCHPLTLGHVQLLAELDSSIPFPPASLTIDDMVMLALVTRYPMWEQAREQVQHDLPRVLEDITMLDNDAIRDNVAAGSAYISYYLSRPASDHHSVPYSDTRAPWWWMLAAFMQSVMGRSESDAWGTIVCDAYAYWTVDAVRNGDEKIMIAADAWLQQQIYSGKTVKQLFDEGCI